MSDLNIEIISKTQVIFNNKGNLAIVPAIDGEIGFMNGHELVVSNLKAGEIKVFDKDEKLLISVEIKGGFAEMTTENKLIILVD